MAKEVTMDSRKPVQNLAETLHSLLGLKAHLTSNWVKSVCDIIKTLPSERSSGLKPTNFEKRGPFDAQDESGGAISKIKDELAALTSYINQLNIQRRQVLNDLLDLKGNIRVFCRIRPITWGENFGCLRPVVALDSSNVLLKLADNKSKSYTFDKVFHPGSSQDEVFSEVEPVIKSVLDGYNACIFAYGQTGTGKTFTMEGNPDAPGIVPLAIEALFNQAADSNHAFLISFSMLEIYMGNLRDLLIPKPTKATDPMRPCLSIQADPKGGIEIENLVGIQVNDFNQALRLYRLGCRFRSTASTNSNITSSRSHCMIRISITCSDAPERRRETNKIWLVDLGGSERVLKTKAWGKRLDEGKAINLSLSALGDVINALQRKKRHIPYRNSKLTQVLKDSLGDDSKTLMLVHVSPKEEDFCETICSLNFATRVKSIHLGNEDAIKVKEQKEIAMANQQQKMKQIEDERLHVRRDIERLNKQLEHLTGAILSSEEQQEAYHLSAEPLRKNRVGDIIAAPPSGLPRFMRPTICSQRKSGTNHQTSEGKDQVLARRRRPSSHRAESLTFPVKNHSEYNSEHSISRSSCLMGLNTKNSVDNATEFSQDTSETDAQMVDLQRQERAARTSISYMQKDRQTKRTNYAELLKVDNWLHPQKNDSAISGYVYSTKRVLAIPAPQKKHKYNGQSKAEKFHNEKVHDYKFTMQEVVNHDKSCKPYAAEGIGRPISEVAIEKPPAMLKDLFNEESRSDSISLSQTTDEKAMIQTQDSAHSSSTEDIGYGIFCPQGVNCGIFDEYKDDHYEATQMSILQAVESEMKCSHNFQLKNHRCCECSSSDLDGRTIYSKGDSGLSISMLEFEPCLQQVPTETDKEDGEREDLDASLQSLANERRLDPLQLRSQRALFVNQKDLSIPFDKLQEGKQTRGICNILKQKIEVVCGSVLLGLGLYNLGLEHDFFYGLVL